MTDVISNSYPRRDNLVEFISLQYALYVSCFVCVLGGALFLATALFIQQDRQQTELAIKGLMVFALFIEYRFHAAYIAFSPPASVAYLGGLLFRTLFFFSFLFSFF
jgi:hypothetical protein